jgi:hypothetical protein
MGAVLSWAITKYRRLFYFSTMRMQILWSLAYRTSKVARLTNHERLMMSTLNRLEKQIDVVLIKKELAIDKNFMLVSNIRKISPGTMIIIMADSINEDKFIENGVDEVVLTPMSAENFGDKILMLIAKKELKEIKEKNG